MLKARGRNAIAAWMSGRSLAVFVVVGWIAGSLSGCASGTFSSPGSGTTTTATTTDTNPNPASLPPLTAATMDNTYVGTQVSGSGGPQNVVSLRLDQSTGAYSYSNLAVLNAQPDPVANSTGNYASWWYFDTLGDETGAVGLPGPQYYGLAAEVPSRLAFAAVGTIGQQIAAMVPTQTSGCITPNATATYEYVTLFGSNFNPATDAAWGTFQLSPSFVFGGAKQYTESSATASTGLIPFSAASCIHSSSGLGYLIDAPASAANGNIEMRAFLGPTGLLTANLQAGGSSGNSIPLPGVVAMAEPSSPVDPSAVAGSLTKELVYRAFVFQPSSSGAQFGLFGHDPLDAYLIDSHFDSFLTVTGATGFFGGWDSEYPNTGSALSAQQGIVFGPQDPGNPGLFPHAKFLYQPIAGDPAYNVPCPSGTDVFAHGYLGGYLEVCSSPAVVMVAQHDGKYVVLVTGIFVTQGNSPTVILMVQE